MYNLLVSGNEDEWNGDPSWLDRVVSRWKRALGACAVERFAPERMCRGGGAWTWLGEKLYKCAVVKRDRRHERQKRPPFGPIPTSGPRRQAVIRGRQAGRSPCIRLTFNARQTRSHSP